MKWMPIETVPNTGDPVLFYRPQDFPCVNRADDWHSGGAHWLDTATHWMPLPEPPSAQEGE